MNIELLIRNTIETVDIDGEASTIAETLRQVMFLTTEIERAEVGDEHVVIRRGEDVVIYDPHEDCPPMECSVCVERGKADVVDGRGWAE